MRAVQEWLHEQGGSYSRGKNPFKFTVAHDEVAMVTILNHCGGKRQQDMSCEFSKSKYSLSARITWLTCPHFQQSTLLIQVTNVNMLISTTITLPTHIACIWLSPCRPPPCIAPTYNWWQQHQHPVFVAIGAWRVGTRMKRQMRREKCEWVTMSKVSSCPNTLISLHPTLQCSGLPTPCKCSHQAKQGWVATIMLAPITVSSTTDEAVWDPYHLSCCGCAFLQAQQMGAYPDHWNIHMWP